MEEHSKGHVKLLMCTHTELLITDNFMGAKVYHSGQQNKCFNGLKARYKPPKDKKRTASASSSAILC